MMTLIEDCDTVVKTNASFSAVPGVPAVAGAMTQTQYNFKLVCLSVPLSMSVCLSKIIYSPQHH